MAYSEIDDVRARNRIPSKHLGKYHKFNIHKEQLIIEIIQYPQQDFFGRASSHEEVQILWSLPRGSLETKISSTHLH
jgi:hypothetical protein